MVPPPPPVGLLLEELFTLKFEAAAAVRGYIIPSFRKLEKLLPVAAEAEAIGMGALEFIFICIPKRGLAEEDLLLLLLLFVEELEFELALELKAETDLIDMRMCPMGFWKCGLFVPVGGVSSSISLSSNAK